MFYTSYANALKAAELEQDDTGLTVYVQGCKGRYYLSNKL